MPETSARHIDSVTRTATAALLAIILVAATVALVLLQPGAPLTGAGAGLFTLTTAAVSFYYGGHVAQNTAALEEHRQQIATAASEASSLRSEASAARSEAAKGGHVA